MKTYKELVEEIANSVGSGNVAGISPGDHPVVRRKTKPKSKFMGCPVFELSSEEYSKCLHGKGKYERYARYFEDLEKSDGIKQQVKKTGASSIIIQNKLTGEMSYLVRR